MKNDWPSVIINLRKAQKVWDRLLRILLREGADVRTLGRFYIGLVHTTLLFGSETRVITPLMVKILGRFHQWVVKHFTL